MRSFLIAAALFLAATGHASAQGATPDVAYFDGRLSEMERQIRDLTGQVERLEYRLRRSEARVEAHETALQDAQAGATADQDFSAETTGESTPAQTANPAADDRTAGVLPEGAPQDDYDGAFGLLRGGDFENGEAAFRDFLVKYPDHKLSNNARYWIGESLYAQQRYQQAATQFLESWKVDQRGRKAPDNLLKLGMSLQRLEKPEEACIAYKKLLAEYRGADDRLLTAAKRERRSLNCD